MRYYGAREMIDKETGKGSGIWRYTVRFDDVIMAIGYCSQKCDGHATKQAAEEHHRQYILDHRVKYDDVMLDMKRRCEVCGEFTSIVVTVEGHPRYHLCEKHNNREVVEKLIMIGEVWSSY